MPDPHMQSPVQVRSGNVNPSAVSLEDLARILSGVGGRKVTVERIQADIERGAPVGPGGKINLIHYGSWLCREMEKK